MHSCKMALAAVLHFLWCFISTIGSLVVIALLLMWLHQFYLPTNYVTDLDTKFVLITGCDTGFGNALTKRLDQLGCQVFATCLTDAGRKKLAEECSGNVTPLLMDVTKQESIDEAYEEVVRVIPPKAVLWAVVNNAGTVAPFLTAELLRMEDFQRVMDVNAWGCVRVTKKFLPLLKKSKGRVINIISAAGKAALPMMAAYAMSKYAMEAFTDSTRVELKKWGMTVHGIEPGFFRTQLTTAQYGLKIFNDAWSRLSDAVKEEYEEFGPYAKRVLEWTEPSCQTDISPVINAMEHAVLSKSAKRRYTPGFDHLFIFSWLALMPSFVLDKLWTKRLLAFTPKSMKQLQ